MERAETLARPYFDRPGVVGVYLVGSATRPFRDALSDLDIEVVFTDDAHAALPEEQRHVFVVDEGPPRRVDHEFYAWAWSDFEALRASRQDHFHYPYQHAVILHDPADRIRPVVEALAHLPDGIREERMRVHWLEWVFGVGRARKTWDRDRALDGHLVACAALRSLVRFLFLACGSWPATPHWTEAELWALGVPDDVLAGLGAALASGRPEALQTITVSLEPWLRAQRIDFEDRGKELTRWAFLTPEGRAAFERWGG